MEIDRESDMDRENHNSSYSAMPEPATAGRAERDAAFFQRFQVAIRGCALPLFEETARHAKASGIEVVIELAVENGDEPRISLNAKHPGDAGYSSYSIIGDMATHAVIHREFYADSALTRRQAGLLPSINQKVIDTHLVTLFNKAFALSLPHLLDRHPAGFW